jgi:hypothetical protein
MIDFDPAKFHIGDIVELQVSFIAYPVRNKHRMKIVLRSLALLNGTHSEVCFSSNIYLFVHLQDINFQNARMTTTIHQMNSPATQTQSISPPKLKRRVGYEVAGESQKKGKGYNPDSMVVN